MKNWLATLLILTLMACGAKNDYSKAELEQAHNLQKEILSSLAELEEKLDALNSADLDSLEEVIHEIEESLFEIPGYHLELPGHEGHDHSHERVELTSTEMVGVNKEILKQVNDIKSSLNNE